MKVSVRFFASLREATGQSSLTCEVPEGATVGTLVEDLNQRYPRLPVAAGAIYLAVNQVYAALGHPLKDGDEVAMFPPVSGGRGVA